ncbi:hypothetical protein [Noviherbaspirillum saxi]|uniref:hypothetical protein n=1 Tax=Noviherbaspirillum saxi TaxID=2320863 RepID=UPI001F25E518|nr:hypothetical protein [Noviherbaspirillum saxi]
MTPLRLATPDDLPAVRNLLKDSGLPHQEVDAAGLNAFLIAAGGQSIHGAVGLEQYGNNGISVGVLIWVMIIPMPSRLTSRH